MNGVWGSKISNYNIVHNSPSKSDRSVMTDENSGQQPDGMLPEEKNGGGHNRIGGGE